MAIDAFTMTSGYVTFEQNHRDVVLAVDFNFYGNRMATASADHRIKVYDRKEDNWNLVDTFGAHDAEITDVGSLVSWFIFFFVFIWISICSTLSIYGF